MRRYKYINRLIRKKEIDYMDDINIITGVIGAVISVITMIAKISNGECLPKKERKGLVCLKEYIYFLNL